MTARARYLWENFKRGGACARIHVQVLVYATYQLLLLALTSSLSACESTEQEHEWRRPT